MDSRIIRGARARRIKTLLDVLVERGGDELAVIESELDGFLLGLETHGVLDLDTPRDFDREIDEERRDEVVYKACKRVQARRAEVRAIEVREDSGGIGWVLPPLPAPAVALLDDDPEITIGVPFEDLMDLPSRVTDPVEMVGEGEGEGHRVIARDRTGGQAR